MEIKARAKINLTLDITGRRPDGYHELASVMQEIDLADTLVLEPAGDIFLTVEPPVVAADGDNLVCRAARLLSRYAGVRQGAAMRLYKRIPVGAGLGGGSADAAATLAGLNRLWGLGLAPETLRELGARLGSDIPFCLTGGTALVTGRGETVQPLPPLPSLPVLLVKPRFAVSTAEIYRLWDDLNAGGGTATRAALPAVAAGDWRGVADSLANDLEQVTCVQYPEVLEVKKRLAAAGAWAVLMSGSGPAVFSLWPDETRARLAVRSLPVSRYEVIPTRTVGRFSGKCRARRVGNDDSPVL